MTKQELHKILSDAMALPAETEIIKFKEAKDCFDFDKIGKYFSALSRFFPLPTYNISRRSHNRRSGTDRNPHSRTQKVLMKDYDYFWDIYDYVKNPETISGICTRPRFTQAKPTT